MYLGGSQEKKEKKNVANGYAENITAAFSMEQTRHDMDLRLGSGSREI